MGLIDDLLGITNQILGIRDELGAVIQPVFFVTRTWSGSVIGDGTMVELREQLNPSPAIVSIAHELSAMQGGVYQQGDLILKQVSKQSYSSEDLVARKSSQNNVEKYYAVGEKLYLAVNVRESYITWEVHIRKVSHN